MTISRINQLRKAQEETEGYLRNSTAHVVPYINKLIDLVVEVFSTPKPASHPQYTAEMVEVQRCATYLFEALSHYLFSSDRVEEVYPCLQNPLLLSYGIATALNKAGEAESVAMGRKAVSMGGILSSKYALNSDIGDPQAYRAKKKMPPLDIIQGALINQFKNEWAIEHDAKENIRHGLFTCIMLGHVADAEPEWAIRFMLEHEEQLTDLLQHCHHPYENGRKFLSAVLRTTLTAKPFLELQKQRPEYFEALQEGGFLPEHIETTLTKYTKYTQFKLSEFPFIETLSELHLSSFFINCLLKGTLTHDRLADLRKAWKQYGMVGDIAVEVLKSQVIKDKLAFTESYYAFIKDPSLTPEQILKKSKEHKDVHEYFDVVDGILNKPGERLSDLPVALENHTAFLLTARPVDSTFCKKVVVTPKILEVCLRTLSDWDRERNGALLQFLNQILKDKKHRPALAQLSYEMFHVLKQVIRNVDMNLLRAIKWEDPSIKGELLEDAMGL
jgi:hypothetical protein